MDKPEKSEYTIKFNESLRGPKYTSVLMEIAKVVISVAFGIVLASFAGLGKIRILREVPIILIVFMAVALWYVLDNILSENKPAPCELTFYSDYMVLNCLRRKRSGAIRSEYYRITYTDIKECNYSNVTKEFEIHGAIYEVTVRQNKEGREIGSQKSRMREDSMVAFNVKFESEIDFVMEIEEHSPIRVVRW